MPITGTAGEGQQRREIAGALQHRAGGVAQVHAELVGDDMGERGLAEPGRTEDERVVERLAAAPGRLDEHRHLLAHPRLADVIGQRAGPHRALQRLLARNVAGADDAVVFDHAFTACCSAPRMSSSLLLPRASIARSMRLASCGL